MKYRRLGRSGLRVSCLGLGTRGTFGAGTSEEEAERVLSAAYDLGVTLFDTSEASARAEKSLGRILRSKGWRPDRGLSRKHLLEGLRGSLRRLQLDYVDVVFAGPRPGPAHSEGMDPTLRLLRLEELVRAMSDVIEQGVALYWGTAGTAPADVMDAFAVARQLNLVAPVCQWAELPPEPRLFRQLGLGVVTWPPLGPAGEESPGHGAAKGRPRCPVAPGELQPLAQRLGCSERQLGIAWSLRREGVSSVLVGAETPRGLREQLRALQLLPRLGPAALRELEPLLGGGAAPP
ncbi:voltage-gated potassium channel subunit beta-3-like [Vidua macroura]|uniref:voltage-gated potassium channel subunit beta-3-like n=1 Tax=Vidua macroura TaxID=187451 RepID=UPI0023A7BE3B|nr:voltage-gated potassium channel subunit beta-3-like [Vidua macroura]